MKKKIQVKPLHLTRETIKQLESNNLTAVNGGATLPSFCPTFCVACLN